ncbi:unnamed protein product, partial [Brenthis ino]
MFRAACAPTTSGRRRIRSGQPRGTHSLRLKTGRYSDAANRDRAARSGRLPTTPTCQRTSKIYIHDSVPHKMVAISIYTVGCTYYSDADIDPN